MTLLLEPQTDPGTVSAASPDRATVDALVRETLPLVGHLVREVLGRVPAHVHRDDLISAGMYALTLSAQNFDPTLGVPFARFATIRIRGALTDELRSMDWASRAVRSKARELSTVRAELTHTIGREPSRHELAQAMSMTLAELTALESNVQRAGVMSLHALPSEDGASNLPSNEAGPEGLIMRREQLGYLRDAVAELPEKLRTVVEEYFFANRKMADIAAELGVTESRVSQLRTEALGLMRAAMRGMDETPAPAVAGRQAAAREAYCASVAARTSLAGRLAATTVLGEVRDADVELPIAN